MKMCIVCHDLPAAPYWSYCSFQCRQQAKGVLPWRDRLWGRTKRDPKTGCLVWQGSKNHRGYGFLSVGGKNKKVHRLAWEEVHGPIPDGMMICHSCDNPSCLEPEHLFLGDNSDNVVDCVEKGRANRPVGSDNGWAKLTEAEVLDIRSRYKKRVVPKRQLAEEYGISENHVKRILNREVWKHI